MTLKDHIRDRIATEGPMPFEEFMAVALYHQDGFFGGGALRSEKAGDFLTSPEVSPIFGETLAAFVWSERDRIGEPFAVVDVGAGSGSLLAPLLRTCPVEAYAVEVSPPARKALEGVLTPDRINESLREVPVSRGVVIANELVDNLPMALAQRREGGWRERWVGLDGDGLALVDRPARDEVVEWLDRFAGDVEEEGWVEVQRTAGEWLSSAMGQLTAGSILIIDYGDTTEGLAPRRRHGTLRTYRSHHLGPDPLDEPGETDITADVDFSALTDVARSAGWEATLHRQDDFLSGLGLRERLARTRRDELEAASAADTTERLRLRNERTEIETLLHPRGLGDFRVLVVSR